MVTNVFSPGRTPSSRWWLRWRALLGACVIVFTFGVAACGNSETETTPLGCGTCDPHATCNANRSPPKCTCSSGYAGNGIFCVYLDAGTTSDVSADISVETDANGLADTRAENGNACVPNPCLNGGTCVVGSVGMYTCTCPPGWSGNNCEISGGCGTTNPCQHGTCQPGGPGTFTCTCDAGWMGMTCNVPVNCGAPPTVAGAATPVVTGGAGGGVTTTYGATASYTCNAGTTKTGSDAVCQASGAWSAAPACTAIMCPMLSAPANGTITGTTTVTYACNAGYSLNGNATRTCQINGMWTGTNPTCVDDPCLPDPCNGHGSCQPGSGLCSCNTGWTGANCQTPVTSCTSNPCVHGTCTNADGGGYDCNCAGTGYGGANCDVPVDCGSAPTVTNAATPAIAGGAGGGSTTTYGATATYTCNVGYAKSGADATCQASGMWSAAPACDAISCGAPPTVVNAGTPVVSGGVGGGTTTTYGAAAVYTCNATYTKSGSDSTCALTGTWSAAPTCSPPLLYCDVIYRFYNGSAGDARLHTAKTMNPGSGNSVQIAGINTTTPGGLPSPSPFTPAEWPGGYVRLRFPADNAGTAPVAGPVQLVEYFVPMEFSIATTGVNITTDVDASAGLLSYRTTGCPSMVTGCLTSPVVLNRTCTSVAGGTLTGTTLSFASACTMPNYPGPFAATTGAPASAQITWTPPMSQVDTSVNTSCLANAATYGNVSCSGPLCAFVPAGITGVQNLTWDQLLGDFTFSSTNYATATVTIPEFLVPDTVSDLYTGQGIPMSEPGSHVECGTLAQLSCDEN